MSRHELSTNLFQHSALSTKNLALFFKRVGKQQPIYSVRIGKGYRATGILQKDVIIWFWIGHHDIYDRLLRNL
ncbi:MAG: hypothetical protein D0530_12125 [Methylococcales bacterium]|nr:MAG: hypothetical protein D0530_12125 [Methylococcales bacterium]